jgi:transcriptional regulator with XRE-family HTH domain
MLDINLDTPSSMLKKLSKRFKQKRLEFDLTQEGLASKSFVSLGSIKRFESTGKISLESLLKISFILDCLEDFNNIANSKTNTINSLDELLKEKTLIKKRGTIK